MATTCNTTSSDLFTTLQRENWDRSIILNTKNLHICFVNIIFKQSSCNEKGVNLAIPINDIGCSVSQRWHATHQNIKHHQTIAILTRLYQSVAACAWFCSPIVLCILFTSTSCAHRPQSSHGKPTLPSKGMPAMTQGITT